MRVNSNVRTSDDRRSAQNLQCGRGQLRDRRLGRSDTLERFALDESDVFEMLEERQWRFGDDVQHAHAGLGTAGSAVHRVCRRSIIAHLQVFDESRQERSEMLRASNVARDCLVEDFIRQHCGKVKTRASAYRSVERMHRCRPTWIRHEVVILAISPVFTSHATTKTLNELLVFIFELGRIRLFDPTYANR